MKRRANSCEITNQKEANFLFQLIHKRVQRIMNISYGSPCAQIKNNLIYTFMARLVHSSFVIRFPHYLFFFVTSAADHRHAHPFCIVLIVS